jgi:hypothetical protein
MWKRRRKVSFEKLVVVFAVDIEYVGGGGGKREKPKRGGGTGD